MGDWKMNKYYIRCKLKNIGNKVFSDLTLDEAQTLQERLKRKGNTVVIKKYVPRRGGRRL